MPSLINLVTSTFVYQQMLTCAELFQSTRFEASLAVLVAGIVSTGNGVNAQFPGPDNLRGRKNTDGNIRGHRGWRTMDMGFIFWMSRKS